jgi:hypothetical protein
MDVTARRLDYSGTASAAALLAGVSGLLYSASFVVVARAAPAPGAGLAGAFLLLGAILGAVALVGLQDRLAATAGPYAVASLVFGLAGALAAGLHGGYDLAIALHPTGASATLPSQVDPRGLGTFGLAGLSLLGFSWLMIGDAAWPRRLGQLGLLSGVLLVVIYLGRLILLDPANPLLLGPAALEGFVVNPAWYVWLGVALRAGR